MESSKNEKQLFVRNLSFQTTSEDLVTLFQEYGPLKNTSVAQENGQSKGFGFVKFALEDDAISAMDKLQGHMLHGRKIKLETGVKKERTSKKDNATIEAANVEEPKEENEAPVVPVKTHTKVIKSVSSDTTVAVSGGDSESVEPSEASIKKSRQILVFGIPTDINKKAFKMAVSKLSRKADVELIKEENELSESLYIINPPGKIMMVTATSRAEAAKLLKALNNATVHSLEIRKHMPVDKSLSAAETEAAALAAKNKKEKLVARTLADMTEVEYRKRKCRLIIRNLSFQAIEQNVVDRMSKFGPLVSVEIPRTIIEKVNANRRKGPKPVKSEEEDEAEGESPDQRTDNQVLRPKGFGFVTFLCEKDAKAAVEDSAGLRVCNREVAIDFCMNKESYTKYGIKTAEEEAADEVAAATGEEQQEDEEGNGNDGEGNDEDEGTDSENDAGSDAEEQAEGGEEVEASGEKEKPADDVQEGCTVFVRGLPFDAETADLKAAMRQFGRIVMAIVVKDKLTGISKGSAFVKYSNADEVAACLAEANENSGLTIKDRVCKVNVAVDRESAQKLKTEDRGGKDKRNLYLANEGLIVPKEGSKGESKKGGEMSEGDKEKRQRAQNEKRKKLQNPLFFVSGNRLSIRNLGKDVTDNELRINCLKAVKAALTKGLVTKDDLELHMKAQGSATPVTLDIPAMAVKTCVKSAKVMLDLTRVRNNIPQSRGYGFVEFTHHAHALACLRELNNSARYSEIATTGSVNGGVEATGGKGRLIVEFSLENIQKVKILRDREVRQKQYIANTTAAAAPAKSTKSTKAEDKSSKKDKKEKEQPPVEKEQSEKRVTKKDKVVTESKVVVASEEEMSSKKSDNKKKRKSGAAPEEKAVDSEPVSKQQKTTTTSSSSSAKSETVAVAAVQETKVVVPSAAVSAKQQEKKKPTKEPVAQVKKTTPPVAAASEPSSASVAKTERKLKKGELQKKRKMEHKAAKREAAATAAASNPSSNTSVGEEAPAAKKSRVEAVPAPKSDKPVAEKKATKKSEDDAEGEAKQQRPWGGHKRLRNDKKKTTASKAGANKKK